MISIPKWMKIARTDKNDIAREQMKEIRARLVQQTQAIERALKDKKDKITNG